MLFKILVVLHILGATVWTGGHLVLAVTILPQALKQRDPDLIHQFEEHFEGFGLTALLLQVTTGLWLTWSFFSDLQNFLEFNSYLSKWHWFRIEREKKCCNIWSIGLIVKDKLSLRVIV